MKRPVRQLQTEHDDLMRHAHRNPSWSTQKAAKVTPVYATIAFNITSYDASQAQLYTFDGTSFTAVAGTAGVKYADGYAALALAPQYFGDGAYFVGTLDNDNYFVPTSLTTSYYVTPAVPTSLKGGNMPCAGTTAIQTTINGSLYNNILPQAPGIVFLPSQTDYLPWAEVKYQNNGVPRINGLVTVKIAFGYDVIQKASLWYTTITGISNNILSLCNPKSFGDSATFSVLIDSPDGSQLTGVALGQVTAGTVATQIQGVGGSYFPGGSYITTTVAGIATNNVLALSTSPGAGVFPWTLNLYQGPTAVLDTSFILPTSSSKFVSGTITAAANIPIGTPTNGQILEVSVTVASLHSSKVYNSVEVGAWYFNGASFTLISSNGVQWDSASTGTGVFNLPTISKISTTWNLVFAAPTGNYAGGPVLYSAKYIGLYP